MPLRNDNFNKPRAYGRPTSELNFSSNSTFTGEDGISSNLPGTYTWVNEAGNAINTSDLGNYDTSQRTRWVPSLKTTGQDLLERADLTMIDKRNADENVAENYGGRAWGKVGLTMLGGAAAAGAGAAAWPIIGPYATGAMNLYGGYYDIKHLLSENGISKTWNKFLGGGL